MSGSFSLCGVVFRRSCFVLFLLPAFRKGREDVFEALDGVIHIKVADRRPREGLLQERQQKQAVREVLAVRVHGASFPGWPCCRRRGIMASRRRSLCLWRASRLPPPNLVSGRAGWASFRARLSPSALPPIAPHR